MAADQPSASSRPRRTPLAGAFRVSAALSRTFKRTAQTTTTFRFRRIARRPSAPAFWMDIVPLLRKAPAPAAVAPEDRERYWLLVLEAKDIPRALFGKKETLRLYVPPVATLAAAHEILAFEQERPEAPLPVQAAKPMAYWVIALIAALALWHRVRWGGSVWPGLPTDPQEWLALGGLDAYRVKAASEWWRCFTALTLHADEGHLLGNIITGSLFCLPLCLRVGPGAGFLLTVLGGALGNAATTLFRPASFLSQGFSTAVFAAVGLLAAVAACHAFQHTLSVARAVAPRTANTGAGLHKAVKKALFAAALPLGAGLGLLAMLGGSDAPRVDYLAHCLGLFCGAGLGLLSGGLAPGLFRLRGAADALLQTACLLAALGLLAFSWMKALG